MRWLEHIDAGTLALLIPIVAIVVGGAYSITKAITNHRERLAMIARGINPGVARDE
jgi:hypothetical protein